MGEISTKGLLKKVRQGFEQIEDHRASNASISLSDALMSGFAMFSLKDSSLLEFDERRGKDENLKQIYGLEAVPSDTQMRSIIDPVSPEQIKPIFKDIYELVKGEGVLWELKYLGHYLVSVDGSNYFSSKQVHCEACLERKNNQTGEISYHHQVLAGAIVHPDQETVIPLAPEGIIKQDGVEKNDCERNAAKRFMADLRAAHPDDPFIIIEDALSANGPHIRDLQKHNLRFILGVKEGDHAFLFDQVKQAQQAGQLGHYDLKRDKVAHRFQFLNQVPLNAANQDVLVNFIEYWETKGDKTQHFCWITDLKVTKTTLFDLMRGGRARWKIENETFNTLKNQGYHLEHNYGHGQQNLSINFVLLMMLAFLVDQVQELAFPLFQAVLHQQGSRKRLWQHLRALFYTLAFASLEDIFRALLYGYQVEKVVIFGPT